MISQCDGVEIIWWEKSDFHGTLNSKTTEGFTCVGISTQIAQSLVDRIELLMLSQRDGVDVNLKIRRIKKIVDHIKNKLNNDG